MIFRGIESESLSRIAFFLLNQLPFLGNQFRGGDLGTVDSRGFFGRNPVGGATTFAKCFCTGRDPISTAQVKLNISIILNAFEYLESFITESKLGFPPSKCS